MHFQHSTFFPKKCKHHAECVVAKRSERWERSLYTLILPCRGVTEVRNTAYDNLYRSQNERWCSLHCFQYNAMYQTAKGYEVYEASPSQQITYWFRNGSIAICNFLNFECRYEASWNLITATSGCCRHKLNPDGFMLYLKRDGLMVLLLRLLTRDMNYSIKWNVESFLSKF